MVMSQERWEDLCTLGSRREMLTVVGYQGNAGWNIQEDPLLAHQCEATSWQGWSSWAAYRAGGGVHTAATGRQVGSFSEGHLGPVVPGLGIYPRERKTGVHAEVAQEHPCGITQSPNVDTAPAHRSSGPRTSSPQTPSCPSGRSKDRRGKGRSQAQGVCAVWSARLKPGRHSLMYRGRAAQGLGQGLREGASHGVWTL